MPAQRDPRTQAALESLLRAHGLSSESRLYRCTRREFLRPGEAPGTLSLSASVAAPEAVVDVYRNGHTLVAEQLGPGLAFAELRDNQWRAPDRALVEVRVEDVLAQGGLLYPVESVITEKVWFATLPRGSVAAREVRA
ncbi:MAG TPA: hypothetical protein VF530_21765 [Planctomycetota bacterium]